MSKAAVGRVMTECLHDPDTMSAGYSYVGHFEEAQRRTAAGEGQRRCPSCGLWIWDRHWPARPKTTNKEQL